MKVRLSKDFIVESAQSLPKVSAGHKGSRLHGHSFTIEMMCVGIWKKLKLTLPELCEITIHETPATRCSYRGN